MLLDTYVYYRNHKDDFDLDYLSDKLRLFKLETSEKDKGNCFQLVSTNKRLPLTI